MSNLSLRNIDNPTAIIPSLLDTWDPVQIMRSLLRGGPFSGFPAKQQGVQQASAYVPRFDVMETKESYIFKVDLPGVKEQDLDITLTGNQLTVSGKRDLEDAQAAQSYYLAERVHGSFRRSFTLPDGADTEHLLPELNDGVLTLVVAKRPEVLPRRISIGQPAGPAA